MAKLWGKPTQSFEFWRRGAADATFDLRRYPYLRTMLYDFPVAREQRSIAEMRLKDGAPSSAPAELCWSSCRPSWSTRDVDELSVPWT